MQLPQTAIDAIKAEIESHHAEIAELEKVLSMVGQVANGVGAILGKLQTKGPAPAKKGEKRVMTDEQRAHLSKKIKAAHKKKKKLALKLAAEQAAAGTPVGEETYEVNAITGQEVKGLSLAPPPAATQGG